MRKLLFVLLLVPFSCTITVGCGGSTENKVIEPAPVDTAAEEAQNEADTETPTE